MKSVASYISSCKILMVLAIMSLTSQTGQALQMILSTRDPMCITVTPKRSNIGMKVDYAVSGVNEDQVIFTVSRQKPVVYKLID